MSDGSFSKVALVVTLMLSQPPTAREAVCNFNSSILQFEGTAAEQAKCLLRTVGKGAMLGETLRELPSPLQTLVGSPVGISKDQLRRFLMTSGTTEAVLGGSLDEGLSKTDEGLEATYFVIHDTSTPNYGKDSFPGDINGSNWTGNDLTSWARLKRAHVYVNRVGLSKTAESFSTPWRATKKELRIGTDAKGRFIHVELIQPRRSDRAGPTGNDLIAPMPGFPDAQLKRLALIYVAASVRSGHWLVPAFHAVIDSEYRDGHDDPQNFDLARWAELLQTVISQIGSLVK